jgi:phage terminase large subunit
MAIVTSAAASAPAITPTHSLHRNAKQIQIPVLKPRKYQVGLYEYLDNGGKRAVLAHARRSGKDVIAFNYLVKAACQTPGAYVHMLPTISQARKVIWEGLLNDGRRIIDAICPKAIRDPQRGTSEQDMLIRLVNGSTIRVCGSDNYDSIVGSNFHGAVFSEWALCDPRAWDYLSPILLATNGFAIFISTPRKGRSNHFAKLYKFAKEHSPEWYADLKTIDDTKVMTRAQVEDLIAAGMPREVANQEFFCDFDGPDQGSIYGTWMQRAHQDRRIRPLLYDPRYPVTTAWDFGVRDNTVITFKQVIGDEIRTIDCHNEKGKGLEHYIAVVKQKPYAYSRHIAPPDVVETEFGSGTSPIEIARNHGIIFTVAPKMSVESGIVATRAILPRTVYCERNCTRLIEAMQNYSYKWDEKALVFSRNPLHDWCSDFADAERYYAVTPEVQGVMPDWARSLRQSDSSWRPNNPTPGHHAQFGQSKSYSPTNEQVAYDPLAAFR